MEKEFAIQLGKNIRTARRKRRLTQRQLAENLGLKPQQLSRYEGGRGSILLVDFLGLCLVLGEKPESLLP